MNTYHFGRYLLCSFLMLAAISAQAELPLSLDEAVNIALQNQPLLQSLDDASSASREAAVASGQLPDPRLNLGIVNLPISGGDTGRFNRDDMTMSTIGISQEMVPQSKRQAASQILEASAEQYQTEKAATARTIERDVALAWLDAYEAQRQSDLYDRIINEFEAERKALAASISSGGAQAIDALRIDSQLSMTVDKKLMVNREERKARARLARWIGPSADRPLEEVPATRADNKLILTGSIENHPLLQNAHQIESVAMSEVNRAKAERDLNWSWEVMYGKRTSDLSDMVTFQVSIDLPWDRANRQDRGSAEKLLMVERARKLTEDRRRELNAELDNAKADIEIAIARDNEHTERLIPTAKARLKVALAGYSAGKQNLAEVWEARRALVDVEMEHLKIITDQQRAAVNLDYMLNRGKFTKDSRP